MPTFETTAHFDRDFGGLSAGQRSAFVDAVSHLVADLQSGRIRKGLRVRGVKGARGIFEMTWANDGRATFQYGSEVRAGEVHVVWRRIGGHEIFPRPLVTAHAGRKR